MINVRRGTFETNSSSTHSICVTKGDEALLIPNTVSVNIDEYEFGWEYEKWCYYDDKIAYFVLGILNISYNEGLGKGATMLEEFINDLKEFGVKEVDITGVRLHHYQSQYYLESDGYVDHSSDLKDFVEELMANKETLKRFLFSTDSFILGGNDNSDGYQDIKVDYDHEEYYKGN